MTNSIHPICKLIMSGLSTALLAAFVSPIAVIAQDEEEVILEEVIVTGSRLQKTDFTSTRPVSIFTDTDIAASGYVTMEDFVRNIPAVTGGYFGSTVNNGNPGWATVSMRGLGSNRTLVLLNGRRMPSAGINGFVDLNMVPANIVERVEVLRDGASTAYGFDAIAGVVNIITKKNFQGQLPLPVRRLIRYAKVFESRRMSLYHKLKRRNVFRVVIAYLTVFWLVTEQDYDPEVEPLVEAAQRGLERMTGEPNTD